METIERKDFMTKALLLALALSSNLGYAKECTYAETQRGCKTTFYHRCYPKLGDCTTVRMCACPTTDSDIELIVTDEVETEGSDGEMGAILNAQNEVESNQ
jgi:hypothetical protein